jgi:hypothetical protein
MPAGTIALTNNSVAVTGSGTAFPTELKGNDFLVAVVGGTTYTLGVKSVESATALTLTTSYGGPTTSGLAWTPIPNGTLVGITAQIAADTARAIRGLNYDKQNWQQVYSSSGNITVTLPDGSTWAGPSWKYLSDNMATKVAGAVPVNQGGTGGNTQLLARAGLGVPAGVDAQMCTAWAMTSGLVSPAIYAAYNISSVVLLSTGIYQINFTVPMANTFYSANASFDPDSDAVAYFNQAASPRSIYIPQSQKNMSNFRIYTGANLSTASQALNARHLNISVFGGK